MDKLQIQLSLEYLKSVKEIGSASEEMAEIIRKL